MTPEERQGLDQATEKTAINAFRNLPPLGFPQPSDSESCIPTTEEFKRAEQAVIERHAGLEEASGAALDQLQAQYPLAHLQLFPHRVADFHAYVFFDTGAQVAASENDGSRSMIEDAVHTAIANAGRGTRAGTSIVFEYDSEENVKANFQGSYHLRMR